MDGVATAAGLAVPDAGIDVPVEGPSFPLTLKWAASAMVALLLLMAADHLPALLAQDLPWTAWAMITALAALVGASYAAILKSRTAVDGQAIDQRGLWRRRVALADIVQVKLIHWRGWEWLLAPRLVVRARGFGVTTFHAADPQVLARFRLLAYGELPS